RLITARDQAHRRLVETLERGERPPVDLKGEIIYYAGPSPAPPGKAAGSVGPTTASRMDPYTPRLAAEGIAACIGKGPRSPETRRALVENGVLYLVGIGGAAALLGSRVRAVRLLAYEDLGPEAVYELEVEDFPVLVAYDLRGGDVFAHHTCPTRPPGGRVRQTPSAGTGVQGSSRGTSLCGGRSRHRVERQPEAGVSR
ncbi:MAG: FumA C-terminus/TtdB family hydratase beta subunit, partial [Actinomycetota bacterium]|nr:FumA C-terminus/TtdB family hydratase beta subunit [Actinomycetota bacterium]